MYNFNDLKIALAPLAGISDYSFRKICREHGLKYAVTEMVSAKAVHYKDKKTAELAFIHEDEPETSIQLFGSEPEIIAEAAQKISTGKYEHNKGSKIPVAIDINMGCPVNKIVSNKEGSALMKKPDLVGKIIRSAVDVQPLPVTVKIRAGWDSNNLNAVEIAQIAQENGASMICVHGRTREEMYLPPVRFDIIKAVNDAVKIPVFANGGIMNADLAIEMFQKTGADGVMIARGAIGNPWIFEEIDAKLNSKAYKAPEADEIVYTALRQLEYMIKDKGERIAVAEIRKHIAYYTKGMKGSSTIRGKINYAQSYDEVNEILKALI